MNTTNSILFCMALCMAFALSSCGPDGPCEGPFEKRYYMFDEEKHLNPYSGYDTLKFKHANGNIYTFYGQGLDSGFSVQSSATSPDCQENILTYRQAYFIRFQSEDYGKIEFKKYLTSLATSNGYGDIGVSRDGVNQYSTTSIYYKFKTNNVKFKTNNVNYFDSLKINNKTYYKVIIMDYNLNNAITNKTYFNMDYGILKIIIDNDRNDILERVPD